MNWKKGGPPGELRNADGMIESKPPAIAEIFHDKLEEKVGKILADMEEYEESPTEEKIALEHMFKGILLHSTEKWEFLI